MKHRAGLHPLASYRYSDANDTITMAFIDEASLQDYWRASEERILAVVRNRIETHGIKTFADLGCGDGRLYPAYRENLQAIFLVEPDPQRLANSAGRTLGDNRWVRFASKGIEAFTPPSPLDGALCSHVLQHVAEADALRILRQIGGLVLRPQGHLFLMVAHSLRDEDIFTAAEVEDGRLRGQSLSREQFERYVRKPPPGLLFNHAFSADSIERLLDLAGFEVVESRAYHLEKNGTESAEELMRREDEIERGETIWQGCADLFIHARTRGLWTSAHPG